MNNRASRRAVPPPCTVDASDKLAFGGTSASFRWYLCLRPYLLATLAALIVLHATEELPAHLRRATDNGLTRDEISALITHVAFYGGFPSAITASALAHATLD
jgi:alkylhydroperoxidase/carboxymuconolactone decarboxylase family protein YurZ